MDLNPESFYCPQLNADPRSFYGQAKHKPKKFTLDYYMGSGKYEPNPEKTTIIRSSFAYLAESQTVKNRMTLMESNSLLVNDNTFFGAGTSHCRYKDFWNVGIPST